MVAEIISTRALVGIIRSRIDQRATALGFVAQEFKVLVAGEGPRQGVAAAACLVNQVQQRRSRRHRSILCVGGK